MKRIMMFFLTVLFMGAAFLSGASYGQEPKKEWDKLGFRDENGDGVNDLFRDADGDGINDVTGKLYRHNFAFVDADKDGRNDLFRDADGDGENDLFRDFDGDGINDAMHPIKQAGKGRSALERVIDFDGDGVNDVTGMRYSRLMRGRGFVDEDGDGFNDNAAVKAGGRHEIESGGEYDTFRDEDGDGINDGRGLGRHMRGRDRSLAGRFGRKEKDR
ncbi:MAG: hypothetical protein J7M24_03770 [Candidatus Latescibacteria bacterium]|nr:hypothetical protein [Candidatus Latescibacterota bacterium]